MMTKSKRTLSMSGLWLRIAAILLILLLISSSLVTGRYARFLTIVSSDPESARVAKFGIDVSEPPVENRSAECYIDCTTSDQTYTYDFSVSNQMGDDLPEVDVNYIILVEFTKDGKDFEVPEGVDVTMTRNFANGTSQTYGGEKLNDSTYSFSGGAFYTEDNKIRQDHSYSLGITGVSGEAVYNGNFDINIDIAAKQLD